MDIKGTAVKSIPDYVRKTYPERFKEWLDSLPDDSKMLFREGISSAEWYDMQKAAVIPTSKVGEVFFNDPKKGAWESGRFSAEIALNGIYKLYVKMSSPGHIIDRAGRVFSAYYAGTTMEVTNKTSSSVDVVISRFDEPNEIIEFRIGGWMQKALEISGCKGCDIVIEKSLARGDDKTIYKITWK